MSTSQGTCVRIEQTSEAIRVTYEICRAGGARTGIENRCLHQQWELQMTLPQGLEESKWLAPRPRLVEKQKKVSLEIVEAHEYQSPVFSSPSPCITPLNVAIYFDALAVLLPTPKNFIELLKLYQEERGLGCAIWGGFSSKPQSHATHHSMILYTSGDVTLALLLRLILCLE